MAQEEAPAKVSPFLSDSSAKSNKRRHATENLSLRIDSKLKLILSQEAKKRRINLNALTSQIFTAYVDWWRYAEELHMIPFNRDVLKDLFQCMNLETLQAISSKAGGTFAREEIVFLFKHVNMDTLLRYIELRSTHFPAYHHWIENGIHNFTLQHDLGINFSIFAKGYLSSMVRDTVGATVDFLDVSPSSITYSIIQ